MSTRNELRAEWSKLDMERRGCKDAEEKTLIVRKMNVIEYSMRNSGDIDANFKNAEVSPTESSLSSGGEYRGMCSHGMNMGDGNYWVSARRN